MTLGELQAYAEELEPLQAEAMLNAASVALYPSLVQFAGDAATSWWNHLLETARGTAKAAVAVTTTARHAARLTFNGAVVSVQELKQRLGASLGGGMAE
jgi:hypothetical protein